MPELSDVDYWEGRLHIALLDCQRFAVLAWEHAQAGRVWEAVNATASALATATIAREAAGQWRTAQHGAVR